MMYCPSPQPFSGMHQSYMGRRTTSQKGLPERRRKRRGLAGSSLELMPDHSYEGDPYNMSIGAPDPNSENAGSTHIHNHHSSTAN